MLTHGGSNIAAEPPAVRLRFLEFSHKLSPVAAPASYPNRGTRVHAVDDFSAPIASGSFLTSGMIVAPCSVRSMSEIATAIVLTVVIALGLRWVPANSAMINGWDWRELTLPVLTLVLYDFGYVARMTRASMAEVMTSQYVRTAVLKGLPHRHVIWRHALRNALIAPFTVIVLQLNWILSGVVVVEVFFQYAGFGKMLLDAALYGDVYVIQAATLVAVFVAVASQIISDVGYTFLNPRIRFR